jgi:hypothetical protein
MTTPQVPANALDVSDVSDEINPASYTQGQQDIGANNSVRQLAGTAAKTVAGSEILFSDLSNKIGFSEIYTTSTTNTQGGIAIVGAPVTAGLTLQANSDMYDPLLTWTYTINGGSDSVTASDITVTKTNSKTAVIQLSSTSGTKVANLTVTGVMTVDGHTINTCTKNIQLTVNAVNTAFQVTATPSFTVNATGISAQTATITVKASANGSLNQSFVFTPTFVSGTGALTPIVGSDTVTFTATAPRPLTNSAIYSLLTEFYSDGKLVAANTSTIDIKAQFVDREITSLTPAALSNNQFSNSTSQYSTIDVTAVHNSVAPDFPQGTVTFTLETTGDVVTQQTISSNTSTKVERVSLYHNKDADGFGFKKASVVVVATLRAPDNTILDQKRSAPIVLRAGTYGLTIVPPPSNTQSGYSAQTATASGAASWGAGTFKWTSISRSNPGPKSETDDIFGSSTLNLRATTPSGKNRAQAIVNTATFEVVGQLTYDGVEVKTETIRDILLKAESLPYTYTITTPATSNLQMEVSAVAAARMVINAAKSIGTITWSRDNSNVGMTPNPTSVLIEVESPAVGGSNTQSVIVAGTLLDPSSRVIETLFTPIISLDAATTKLAISGEDAIKTSDKRTDSSTGVFETTAAVGNHKFRFPPTKNGGNDLQLTLESPQRILITATATQASNSGSYELTAEVDYKGIIRTVIREATVTINALAPTLTATKFPATWNTVSSVGSFTGIGLPGSGGGNIFVQNRLEDIVVESDYPGTINVDYEIRRVTNRIGKFGEVVTNVITGPFYNQTANTNAAPEGHPASSNKRRDRVTLDPFLGFILDYDFTYELYDKPGGKFLRDLRVSSLVTGPKIGAIVTLNQDNITSKTFTFTNKSNNGFGYPEPHPLEVNYEQRVDFTSSYVSETSITTPKFSFTATSETPGAVVALVTNPVNGQAKANVTVKSVYYDSSINFSGTLPTITQSSGKVNVSAQLTSTVDGTTYNIGDLATKSVTLDLPIPSGRCYRLSTFSYGPRMYHTRDVFSNSNEQIDYSRIPGSSSFNGPETKFVGFHDGSTVYALSNRPLYGSNTRGTTRYYSSTGHRSAHGNETPNVIIPTGYFMIMSFAETGIPAIGAITFIGSDGKAYPCGGLWAKSVTTQNDTSRDNDAFDWFIFEPPVLPVGVTADYVFISNGGSIDRPPPSAALVFTAVQPGNALIGQDVNLNIGSVTGGIILEDQFVDPGNIAGGGGGGGVGIAGDSQAMLASDS